MGLSSSQARLLLLTSRLSDIELQEVMISQRQSQLARKSQEAAEVYSDAMNIICPISFQILSVLLGTKPNGPFPSIVSH